MAAAIQWLLGTVEACGLAQVANEAPGATALVLPIHDATHAAIVARWTSRLATLIALPGIGGAVTAELAIVGHAIIAYAMAAACDTSTVATWWSAHREATTQPVSRMAYSGHTVVMGHAPLTWDAGTSTIHARLVAILDTVVACVRKFDT